MVSRLVSHHRRCVLRNWKRETLPPSRRSAATHVKPPSNSGTVDAAEAHRCRRKDTGRLKTIFT